MSSRLWPALVLLALPPGCSQPSGDTANSTNTQSNAAAPASTAQPAAAADWRQLAECSSKLEAVARLFSAIASQGSDAQSQEMLTRSLDRQSAAMRFQQRANQLAQSTADGGANPEVERIRTETAARLEAERARQPFEDFAVWLGREADGCAPLDAAPQN